MFKSLVRMVLLMTLPSLCIAQAPQAPQVPRSPQRFAGTLVSVAGDAVTLKDKDGKTFVVQMTPGWTVSVDRKVDASAIKAGQFVASQNVPIDAASGKSTELRILEPGYRPEEGTHVVSATNSNMMTHGTVKRVGKTATNVEVEVAYPNGSRQLVVPPDAPIVLSEPLARGVLKPGIAVGSVTRPGADGVERASRLQLTNP